MAAKFTMQLMSDTKESITPKPFENWSAAMKKTMEDQNEELIRLCKANFVREKLWDIAAEHFQTGVSKQLLKPLNSNPKFLQLAQEVAIFLHKIFPHFTVAVAYETICSFVYPDRELFPMRLEGYLDYSNDNAWGLTVLRSKGLNSAYIEEVMREFICSIALHYSLIQQKQQKAIASTATAASSAAVKSGGKSYWSHSRFLVRLPRRVRYNIS